MPGPGPSFMEEDMLWNWNHVHIAPESVRLPTGAVLGPQGLVTETGRQDRAALYAVFDSGGLKLPPEGVLGQQQVHLPTAFGPSGVPGWRLVPAGPGLWPWILEVFRAWQAGQEAQVIHMAALAWPLRALWSATALGLTLHPDHPVVVV